MAQSPGDEPGTISPAAAATPHGSRRRSQWTALTACDRGAAVDPDRAASIGRRSLMWRPAALAMSAAMTLAIAGAVFIAADPGHDGRSGPAVAAKAPNGRLVPLGLAIGPASQPATTPSSPRQSPTAGKSTPAASAPSHAGHAGAQPPSSPAARSSPAAPSTFRLVAAQSGLCLDVPQSKTAAGTQLDIWDCNGDPNQVWTQTGSKQLTVYSGDDLRCVDSAFGATTPGAFAIIWPCSSAANQWSLNANGTVTDVRSGLCLDVTQNGTSDGSPVQLWTCNGGENQVWRRN